MDEARRELAVRRRVELKEAGRRAESGRDVFQRIDAQRRRDHRHPARRRGARRREIAVAVLRAQTDHADRTHKDRRRQLAAEQFDRKIALQRPAKHPRDESPVIERRHVGILRTLVAAAASDVRYHARG